MIRPLIALALSAILAYGLWEAYPLVAGPSIALSSPAGGTSYPGAVVTVAGRAKRAVSLTLDGAPLYEDLSGHFSTTLAFPPGGSILTLTATDRFGRKVSKERMIYVP